MFYLALALACLLNLCDCPILFLTAPVVEGVPKTKGGSQPAPRIQTDWQPDPRAASFKVQIYTVL